VSEHPEVAEFIHAYISSVWALELLLLLRRDPERAWTAAALVRELRASTSLVSDNLARLQQQGLALEGDDGWRFHPANPRLAALVTELSALYRERPMHVMSLIARSDSIRSLADAFRIRKDET
jgi:DNA-binding IclR family transcriptional regulator